MKRCCGVVSGKFFARMCCVLFVPLLLLPAWAATPLSLSDSRLRNRIEVLETALVLRNEGARMEAEGNIPGAMEAYGKSAALYPDPALEQKIRSFRPDLQALRDRIASLEGLLAAQKPGGQLTASVPPRMPAISGEVRPGEENADWKTYPDLPAEKKAIEESLGGFRSALEAGDIRSASEYVDEDRREVYASLFGRKPEAMPSFAALLEQAEMSFLSAPENSDPAASSTQRTSEYAVNVDGFTFYVRWIKRDGKWVLFDF
jgi:tetratricopeptide (TPR) repeat protein